jgi:probable HAF family extracellular repeat protein
MTDLGTFGGGTSGSASSVNAINDSGQVAGNYSVDGGVSQHGFLLTDGSVTELGSLGGTKTSVSGMNGSGWVVGSSYLSDNSTFHAFLYSNGMMQDLGTFDRNSGATDISSLGQVVGWSGNNSTARAILYYNGVMSDLGTLGGRSTSAFAINDLGQVVGTAIGLQDSHAFIYEGGVMADLNTLLPLGYSGWLLESASDINNDGWITGTALAPDGTEHGYILTPEPAMVLLLGLGGLALRKKRTR